MTIVRLPAARAAREGATGPGALERLRRYWDRAGGGAGAPRSDRLFLSDLSGAMAHILLCYRDGAAWRIEFAGAEVQDLLGFDPTGEALRGSDPEPLLARLADGAAAAARRMEPRTVRAGGRTAIHLPFAGEGGAAAVMLVGVVAAPPPGPGAAVLAFPARRAREGGRGAGGRGPDGQASRP